MPNSIPAVVSLPAGPGRAGAGAPAVDFAAEGEAAGVATGVAGELPSGMGTLSITASSRQVFQPAGGNPENNQ
jgi:hypothetical protein